MVLFLVLPSFAFIAETAGGITVPIDVKLEILAPTTSQGDEIHLNFTAFMEEDNWRNMLPQPSDRGFEVSSTNFSILWSNYIGSLISRDFSFQGDIYLSNASGYVMTQGGAQPIVEVYFEVSDPANPSMEVSYIERENLYTMEVEYAGRDIDATVFARQRTPITYYQP